MSIDGIFCFRSLGLRKPSQEFFDHILASVNAEKDDIVMIGDDLEKDVYGALNCGIDAIWLNTQKAPIPDGVTAVTSLGQILQPENT
jgi:putative hydrolase of the HAD superfamily